MKDNYEITNIKQVDNWTLSKIEGMQLGKAQKLLSDLFEENFDKMVAAVKSAYPQFQDVPARMVLLDADTALDHDVPDTALGFHYVCSEYSDEEGGMDFAADHTCAINLDGCVQAIADDVIDRHSLEAALVTGPHEMFHLMEWIRLSGSKTPVEVFDESGSISAIQDLQAEIEKSAHEHGHEDGEDLVETAARQVIDGMKITTRSFELGSEILEAIEKGETHYQHTGRKP